MACPNCGGTDRRAISPGFWECTSLVYREIPTGLHPSGKFGPPFQTVAHPCGRRYQDGAPGGTGTLCQTCTVFAIGICADCGNPQCGNCGRHYRGAFLCAQCRQARAAAEQAAAQEAAAEAARKKAADKAAAEAAAARLADARKTWLRAVARSLAAEARPTHREGWAISPATEGSVSSSSSGGYGQYTHTSWVETQLIMTSAGELLVRRRSKPKQTSWRWGNKWTAPASPNAWDPSAFATYIRTQYGVSVPKFDAPN
jgi:hypothetical protein